MLHSEFVEISKKKASPVATRKPATQSHVAPTSADNSYQRQKERLHQYLSNQLAPDLLLPPAAELHAQLTNRSDKPRVPAAEPEPEPEVEEYKEYYTQPEQSSDVKEAAEDVYPHLQNAKARLMQAMEHQQPVQKTYSYPMISMLQPPQLQPPPLVVKQAPTVPPYQKPAPALAATTKAQKAQKVEEMLQARKQQKLQSATSTKSAAAGATMAPKNVPLSISRQVAAPPKALSQPIQKQQPPPVKYYESIQERIQRQGSSQSYTGTPKIPARNLTPAQGTASQSAKQTPQMSKSSAQKLDIQRRIIDLMLDSEKKGTPSRTRFAPHPMSAFGTCPVSSGSKNPAPATSSKVTKQRPVNLPPRQQRPTSTGQLPFTSGSQLLGGTMPKPPLDRGLQSQLNVAVRNEKWLQQKNEKIARQQTEKEAAQVVGCTFRPHFETQDHKLLAYNGLSGCQSVYKGLSPTKLSAEEMNVIMHSNSYSQINEIKSRSRSRDKSMSLAHGQSSELSGGMIGYREQQYYQPQLQNMK